VVELDRDIGQIMDKLQELGLSENTLVIAMADNGPMHELAPMGPHEIVVRGGKGDYLKMAPYLWAWAAFDHMRECHLNMIEQYPNRPQTHGVPYEGIVDLPAEAKALVATVPTTY